MTLGEIIKNYRQQNNLSMQEFADKIGASKGYIHMIEHEINPSTGKPINPSVETLKALAWAMNMDIEDLIKCLDGRQLIYTNEIACANQLSNSVPLLGVVKAGYDFLCDENLLGYVETDIKNIDEHFALKVTGDSMQPVLYDGDIVIVHQQPDVESGQVAVILLDDEATIKKVVKYDNYIELVAYNSYYPPKRVDKGFKIIGRVIEARIKKIFE